MAHDMPHDALAMIEYGDNPVLLVFADSEGGMERARQAAALAGCRVSDGGPVAGAVDRLDRQIAAGAVLVEIREDHGAALDRLLDRLEAAARAGRHGSVVTAPPALIDIVAARTSHENVRHLCAPTQLDRVAAIGLAAVRAPARLHDINRGAGTARLQQLSEEVGRIATILATLSDEDVAAPPPEAGNDEGQEPIDAGQVRAMIRARRLRDQYFQAELFADPAWDMLLDLMAARLERQKVAVSSLCIAAAVPATTALRWIKTLTDHGLFVRAADPQDGRRVFIELSDKAAASVSAYVRAAQRVAPAAI